MWRKFLRALGCTAYLGILLGIFALVSYLAFSQFVRRGVTRTPDLFGLPESEALALVSDQGLRLEWLAEEERFHDEVPKAHVLTQEPRAGTLVKRGRTVRVIPSKGPQRIDVPPLAGQSLQAAQVELAAAGLRVGRTLEIHSNVGAAGTVVAQDPPEGAKVEIDAAVDLFLARGNGAATYVMPDLVYMPYEKVKKFFETRGFRLGRVSYATYEGIPPGTVLRQYPLPGYPIGPGEVISLGVTPLPEEAYDYVPADVDPDSASAESNTGEGMP
jgi:serine/threonine-protein kinase